MGFRAPLKDLASPFNGGDDRLDIYVEHLGTGYYGWCTSDDPHLFGAYPYRDVSAYCKVDNDYAGFSGAPLDNLRVTAAHEFFHAIQYAYDFAEDSWFMEGTATWVEDEVYDAINDNYQYLRDSAMADPRSPIDEGMGYRPYGSFLYWRYLAESISEGPGLIRRIWERADGSLGGRDAYSLQAVIESLPEAFSTSLARFFVWNYRPSSFYEEGRGYEAATRPKSRSARQLSVSRARTRSGSFALDHLAGSYVRFQPRHKRGRLRLQVDAPPGFGVARALVVGKNGERRVRAFLLDAAGSGTITTRFSSRSIREVVLVLVNSSTVFECSSVTPYSCSGIPRDDERPFSYSASFDRR